MTTMCSCHDYVATYNRHEFLNWLETNVLFHIMLKILKIKNL